jgi:hypothetical protein
MRLSEERVAALARRITEILLDEEHVDLEITEERFRFLIENLILEDLRLEERIDAEATQWLRTNKAFLQEGSTEWELAMEKVRDDIAISKGYVIH